MMIVRGICGALTAFLLYGTVCPMIRTKAWWVRVMDFPRVQFVVLAALTIVALFYALPRSESRRWIVVLGILVGILIVQVVRIFPFTRIASPEVEALAKEKATVTLRLLVANVEFDNRDPQPLLALLERKQPDVVFLVETDERWLEALEPARRQFDHTLFHPRPKGRGLALLSRLPLTDTAIRHIVSEDRPSLRATLQLPDGRQAHFWGLHPAPPGLEKDGERLDSGERDTELIRVAREIGALPDDEICIVAGDFNDAAWSHTTRKFKRESGMLDPRVGRGRFNTYHAQWFFLRYPIDHIFVSPSLRLIEMERLTSIGSDHFPMWLAVGY